MNMLGFKNPKNALLLAMSAVVLAGCHTDMWVQPKHHEPYQQNTLFDNGMASRPLPEGSVAQGSSKLNAANSEYVVNGKYTDTLPATLTLDGKKVDTSKDLKLVLNRGQERFNIFCSNCHGKAGDGKGMIAQRGINLKRPPATYHTDRLRQMPLGHFYDVITNGFGLMLPQAPRIHVDDRWAIVAYVRALQLSQYQSKGDLTPDQQQLLEAAQKPAPVAAEAKGGHE